MPKVALVTGGASGIGRAACLSFAKLGIAVVVADVDEAGGQQTVEEVSGGCSSAVLLQFWISDRCIAVWASHRDMRVTVDVRSSATLDLQCNVAHTAAFSAAGAQAGTHSSPSSTFVKTDVTKEEDVKQLMEHIRNT